MKLRMYNRYYRNGVLNYRYFKGSSFTGLYEYNSVDGVYSCKHYWIGNSQKIGFELWNWKKLYNI